MILTEERSTSCESPHFLRLTLSSLCTFIVLNCPVEITYLIFSVRILSVFLQGGVKTRTKPGREEADVCHANSGNLTATTACKWGSIPWIKKKRPSKSAAAHSCYSNVLRTQSDIDDDGYTHNRHDNARPGLCTFQCADFFHGGVIAFLFVSVVPVVC